MLHKIRFMGKETKYSALSVLSLAAVFLLHLVHWLAAPSLMGAAAVGMHMEHQHDMGGSGSTLMQLLMLVVFIVNLVSMYFAGRRLSLAWKNRSGATHRTYLCSFVSVGVLCVGFLRLCRCKRLKPARCCDGFSLRSSGRALQIAVLCYPWCNYGVN
ncbi:hypothetical protein LJK88_26435 [Paenibacillus sp. P26]|nr:hypothetical protein LJK88_26435 [Paenibacillus sp. P26]